MTRRWSLRTRFVLAALACLLPLVGVAAYILFQSLEHGRDQLIDTEEAVTELVVAGLTQSLDENEEVLTTIANEDSVVALDVAGTEAIFQSVRAARPRLLGLFLYSADHAFLVRPGLNPEQVRADLEPTLTQTLQAGATAVSGRLSIGGQDVIAITVPVWADAEQIGTGSSPDASATPVGAGDAAAAPVGVVGALLSVEGLERTFTPFANEQTEIWIATANQVISTSAAAGEGDSLTIRLADQIARALGGAEGIFSYDDASSDERLAVYAPVSFEGADWAVIVSAPAPRTYGPSRALLQQGVAALALAVFATLLLALFFGEVTARPLRQLTSQAAALAEGNFSQRIEPTGGGEVRSLSIAFREMEGRLADQVRDLDTARREREQQAEELRDLNRRTVRLQEEERRRIAADIHDAVSPLITGALYQTNALRIANDGLGLGERDTGLDATADLLERAGSELHGVIFALRPPDLDDIGVVAAIERYMASIQRHGLTCRLEVVGEPPGLTPDARLGVYRIVQEALHNVVRHSGADEAVVRIEATARLYRVVVRDNGSGFDPERAQGPTSLGLLSMRERAAAIGATVEIASTAGTGTVVVIERPTPGAVVSPAGGDGARPTPGEVDAVGEGGQSGADGHDETGDFAAPRRAARRGRPIRVTRAATNGANGRNGSGGTTGDDGDPSQPPAEPTDATAAGDTSAAADGGPTAATEPATREGHLP